MNTQTATEHKVQFVDRLRSEAAEPLEPISTKEVTKETQIIAIYGKGGIGKSFTLANLSHMMAEMGKRVLLITGGVKSWSVVAALDPYQEPAAVQGDMQIDLEQAIGQSLERELQAFLSATFIADHVQAVPDLQRSGKPQNWSFGIKPMAPRWMPEAPNSVFQLSQFVAEPAVAWHA